MRYISMFSGIEAASQAWSQLGWEAVAFSEIENFPSSVLKYRWPDVQNLGDMTKVDWGFYKGKVDLVVGGPPCQAFSVAGLRKSLSDDRGNLSLQYVKAIHAIRPRWVVTENVPGWLNTGDNAFGCFLAGLIGSDDPLVSRLEGGSWPSAGIAVGPRYAAVWRVLDSQFFGVPQRRNRVFVVANSGNWRNSAQVLLEPSGLRRDSSSGQKKEQRIAGGPAGSLGGRGTRSHTELDGHGAYVPYSKVPEVAETLRSGSTNKASHGKLNGSDRVTLIPQAYGGNRTSGPLDVATAVRAKGGTGHGDFESETFVADVAPILSTKAGANAGKTMEVDGFLIPEMAHSLRADGFDASEDGTGRGTPLIPMAFHGAQDPDVSGDVTHPLGTNQGREACIGVPEVYDMRGNGDGNVVPNLTGDHASRPTDYTPMIFESRVARNGRGAPSDIVPPLKAQSGEDGRGDAAPLIFHENQRAEVTLSETAGSLKLGGGKPGQGYPALMSKMQVRRLTPKEAERLMGMTDDYTLIPYNNGLAKDGPRYKACGNSFVVNVVHWIGKRIEEVDRV